MWNGGGWVADYIGEQGRPLQGGDIGVEPERYEEASSVTNSAKSKGPVLSQEDAWHIQ